MIWSEFKTLVDSLIGESDPEVCLVENWFNQIGVSQDIRPVLNDDINIENLENNLNRVLTDQKNVLLLGNQNKEI